MVRTEKWVKAKIIYRLKFKATRQMLTGTMSLRDLSVAASPEHVGALPRPQVPARWSKIKPQSLWECLVTGRPGCSLPGRVETDLVSSEPAREHPREMTKG